MFWPKALKFQDVIGQKGCVWSEYKHREARLRRLLSAVPLPACLQSWARFPLSEDHLLENPGDSQEQSHSFKLAMYRTCHRQKQHVGVQS